MLAKEFDEIFHKVIKGFEWGPVYKDKGREVLKSVSSFLNIDGKIEYFVATRKFMAVLHEPDDNAEAGNVRPKGHTTDYTTNYNKYVKAEGQKELPEGYGLQAEGAILMGRAAKLFGFDKKPWIEVDYVNTGDNDYAIRIRDTHDNVTYVTMLRNETAHVPEWIKYTEEEKAEMEAEEKRYQEKAAEYAEIERTLEA